METGNATLTADATPARTRRVALLTDRPAGLARLEWPLRRFLGAEPDSVRVWVCVERFRAAPSTPVAYRRLARVEARSITAERLAQAEAIASTALGSWSTASLRVVEAIADPSLDLLAAQVSLLDIDLLACDASSGAVHLAEDVAALTGRPVLLIPAAGSAASFATHRRLNPAARLLRGLHG